MYDTIRIAGSLSHTPSPPCVAFMHSNFDIFSPVPMKSEQEKAEKLNISYSNMHAFKNRMCVWKREEGEVHREREREREASGRDTEKPCRCCENAEHQKLHGSKVYVMAGSMCVLHRGTFSSQNRSKHSTAQREREREREQQ